MRFADLVAREQAQPVFLRKPHAIHEPMTIAGRLTEFEPSEIKAEDGSDEESDSLRNPYTPSPTAGFIGLVDNQVYIPLDTQGAVGPNHLVTMLNSQVLIQNKAGVTIGSPVSLDGFFATVLDANAGTFDPHISYDAATNHWIAVVAAMNFNNFSDSRLLLAVSSTSDPTGSWSFYSILTDPGTNWSDYPTLGISGNWITVTVNKFSVSGGYFVKSTVYAFTKAQAENGATVSYYAFDDTLGFTLNPVVTYDAGVTTQYLVDDQTAYGYSGKLRISTISGSVSSAVYTPGAATASTANPWSFGGGDVAPQLGFPYKINNGDSRVINSVYRNGSIWGAQTAALPATNPTHTAAQWWQISPTGTVQQFGRVDDASGAVFRAYPSIAVNNVNDVLIGYARFSSATYPSANYSYRNHTDTASTMEAEGAMKAGEAPYYKKYNGNRNRWGDYSATVVDPSDDQSFWSLQEYAKSPSSTWSTWWSHIPFVSLPTLTSVSLSANTTVGGSQPLTGTVTMSSPVARATIVTITSSNSGVVVTNPTVQVGQSTANFTVYTSAVGSNTTVTITATFNGVSVSTFLTVIPLGIASVTVNPTSVTGGALNPTGTITLNAAPKNATTIALASSNQVAAAVPASATVAAGTTSVTFPVTTQTITTTVTPSIRAVLLGKTQYTSLTVQATTLALTISPGTVAGGHNAVGLLTIGTPAPPNGLSVTLSSNNTNATLASTTVIIPAGQTTARFVIGTQTVTADTNVTITAQSGGLSSSASFTIAAIRLTSMQFAPAMVQGGFSTYLTINFNGPAPAGTVVTLTSSNPGLLPVYPVTVSGATAITILLDTAFVSSPTTVTVTGTSGGVTVSTAVTITP